MSSKRKPKPPWWHATGTSSSSSRRSWSTERSLQFGQMKKGIRAMLATAAEPELPRVERPQRRRARPPGRVAADPATPAEERELDRRRDEDPRPRPPVAEAPSELGDVAEVLAVEADNERGEEEHRGDDGQHLHHLVLIVRDLRLVVVAHAGQEVAGEVETVHGTEELVVDVREVDLDLAREELLALLHVEAPVDDLVDRVARR